MTPELQPPPPAATFSLLRQPSTSPSAPPLHQTDRLQARHSSLQLLYDLVAQYVYIHPRCLVQQVCLPRPVSARPRGFWVRLNFLRYVQSTFQHSGVALARNSHRGRSIDICNHIYIYNLLHFLGFHQRYQSARQVARI